VSFKFHFPILIQSKKWPFSDTRKIKAISYQKARFFTWESKGEGLKNKCLQGKAFANIMGTKYLRLEYPCPIGVHPSRFGGEDILLRLRL